MKTDLFDFDLPSERIALRPANPRESARLMVVRPSEGGETLEDRTIGDLPDLLHLELAQVVRGSDRVEKRRLTEYGHGDIPILHVGKSRPT